MPQHQREQPSSVEKKQRALYVCVCTCSDWGHTVSGHGFWILRSIRLPGINVWGTVKPILFNERPCDLQFALHDHGARQTEQLHRRSVAIDMTMDICIGGNEQYWVRCEKMGAALVSKGLSSRNVRHILGCGGREANVDT